MLVDRGLDVETAFHQPRVDVSGVGPIRVNRLLPDAVKKAIASKLPITEVDNQISPLGFANPSCIVRDPAVLQRISDEAKRHLLHASPGGVFAHELQAMLGNPEFQIFYRAPALVLITGLADDPWNRIDCALAAENLMLAAADAGLGTCWIGFAQGWLETAEGKALLGIPPERSPFDKRTW